MDHILSALPGLDQLWVADLNYIRLALEFVYLVVIVDALSRRVIGWAQGCTLEAVLTPATGDFRAVPSWLAP